MKRTRGDSCGEHTAFGSTLSCARDRLEVFEESPRDKLLNFPEPFDSFAVDADHVRGMASQVAGPETRRLQFLFGHGANVR